MIELIENQHLSKHLWKDMLMPQVQLPKDSSLRTLSGVTAWGLGIAIENTPLGIRYEHGGNNGEFQSGMMFFLDSKLGYVFFTNSDRGEAFSKNIENYITNFLNPN